MKNSEADNSSEDVAELPSRNDALLAVYIICGYLPSEEGLDDDLLRLKIYKVDCLVLEKQSS